MWAIDLNFLSTNPDPNFKISILKSFIYTHFQSMCWQPSAQGSAQNTWWDQGQRLCPLILTHGCYHYWASSISDTRHSLTKSALYSQGGKHDFQHSDVRSGYSWDVIIIQWLKNCCDLWEGHSLKRLNSAQSNISNEWHSLISSVSWTILWHHGVNHGVLLNTDCIYYT